MATISIDLRMLYSSGIGTYSQNLVSTIIKEYPDIHFNLLGKIEELNRFPEFHNHNVNLIDCRSPIYSISEQIELIKKIPKNTTLFWSPHYNIPIRYREKLLVTIHDLFHLAMPQYVGGLHKRLYANFIFKTLLSKAAAILCVSDFTRSEIHRLAGHVRQQIHVIHIGVAEAWSQIKPIKNPHTKPFLLFVGNVKPHKNLRRLIQAFNLIKDTIDHDLVIIGKKEGFITGDDSVSKMALELRNRVHFTGYIEDNTLKQYFAHANALVFPSLYEGFGLPPLEAMACGCPVVVSNVASLPEVCGDAALYCDPMNPQDIADKIILLLNDDALRNNLRKKGIEQARKFTWEKCAEKTIEVINNLIN